MYKQQPEKTIRIFITGGTFDKEYNELTGKLYFRDTHMQDLLAMGRNQVPVAITTLMLFDSLEMTEKCREEIAQHCLRCAEDKLIITHATDTMTETARVLAKMVPHKTIVLTVP